MMNIQFPLALLILLSLSSYVTASQVDSKKRNRSQSPQRSVTASSTATTETDTDRKEAHSSKTANTYPLISPEIQDFFNRLSDEHVIALLKTRPRLHRKIISALSVADEDGQEKDVNTMRRRRSSFSQL